MPFLPWPDFQPLFEKRARAPPLVLFVEEQRPDARDWRKSRLLSSPLLEALKEIISPRKTRMIPKIPQRLPSSGSWNFTSYQFQVRLKGQCCVLLTCGLFFSPCFPGGVFWPATRLITTNPTWKTAPSLDPLYWPVFVLLCHLKNGNQVRYCRPTFSCIIWKREDELTKNQNNLQTFFELFWPRRTFPFNWRKPENSSLVR